MDSVDDFSDSIAEFLQVNNDRAAIIFAFSMLEQFISDLLKIKSKHSKSYMHLSTSVKISFLHDLGEISDNEYESITWLRKIRNDAAHKAGYKINRSDIQKRWIMESADTIKILENYLITTVVGFWNNHGELYRYYGIGYNK